MSAIKCPDCGRKVSDGATSCPHCGCPASRIKRKSGCQTIIALIILVIFIGGSLVTKCDKSSNSSSRIETQSTVQTDDSQEQSNNEIGNTNQNIKDSQEEQMRIDKNSELNEENERSQDYKSEMSNISNDENDVAKLDE